MKIGRHVRKARDALDLREQDFVDQVEVTSQHISRNELDHATPSVESLLKLSRTLGVTTDHLLTGQRITQLDPHGTIRAEPDISAVAKRHLISVRATAKTKDCIVNAEHHSHSHEHEHFGLPRPSTHGCRDPSGVRSAVPATTEFPARYLASSGR